MIQGSTRSSITDTSAESSTLGTFSSYLRNGSRRFTSTRINSPRRLIFKASTSSAEKFWRGVHDSFGTSIVLHSMQICPLEGHENFHLRTTESIIVTWSTTDDGQ